MSTKASNKTGNSLPTTLRMSALASALLGLASAPVGAAPGLLSESPLFLQNSVQSNIFFMVDDSGSMDWEVLKSRGAEIAYPDEGAFPNSGDIDITPTRTDRDEMLESCAGYNVMYYDPNITYTPWVGVDNAGNPYLDQPINAARNDPYNPGAGTTNLLNWDGADYPGYMVWTDDGDGLFETGECPDPGLAGYNYATQFTPTTAMSATEQTNFANWFSYYRKREFVAKRALSEIITESTARVGLATLHNNNGVLTRVEDVDDLTTPTDPAALANKTALLRNLFRINSSGGTPLRSALLNVGQYFENGNSWGPSPILPEADGGTCQQNFAVVMSDGYWNGDTTTTLVGDADTDNNTAFDGGSYADGVTRTMADIAMHYYERDLRPTWDNNVRRVGQDQNDAQHLVTFTVAFGVNGTLNSNPPNATDPFTWPAPPNAGNDIRTVDDMRHAAWNGRGQFLNAGNPDQLITSLNQAIADIDARSGSAAAVSFNSTSLQGDTMLFQAVFDSSQWTGNLNAFSIDTNGVVGNNPEWTVAGPATNAASGLDQTNYTTRQIYTFNGTAGVDFSWSNLTASQKLDLRTNPDGTTANEATGMARLGFLKGDRTCELTGPGTCGASPVYDDGTNTFTTKTFRNRGSRLGDIVHSSPFFVGPPSTPYPDTIAPTPYSNFVNSAAASRRKVVYVGANDGMLHAFDTENDGDELFAYIPASLYATTPDRGLHYLTDPSYLHKWYVDLSATATDVYLSGWKTVLIGGLRGGGKGLFALDVTAPSTFDATDIMWEFTHADLGYTFSDVRVAKMNNGKWAAIFGNGYNSDPAGTGRAKLFIVYLDGSNLSSPKIIDTGAGSMVNANCGDPGSDCNGLSSPAIVDLNGDGSVDRVYAGDLHGKLWAFDVSASTEISWGKAYANPLMNACTSASCVAGNRQPITARPSVARHRTERSVGTEPNLMIYFGTGQYLTSNDALSTQQQTFYGVWDSGANDLDRSDLTQQTISTATLSNGAGVRLLSDTDVDYSSSNGWYIDLPSLRERAVTNSVALGDLVFFNTVIPSDDQCGFGGSGWLMIVDQENGGMPNFNAVDANGDGVIDEFDMIGDDFVSGTEMDGIPTESRFISDKRVTTDSSGGIQVESVQMYRNTDPARTSWTNIEY